jgi:serine protease Do
MFATALNNNSSFWRIALVGAFCLGSHMPAYGGETSAAPNPVAEKTASPKPGEKDPKAKGKPSVIPNSMLGNLATNLGIGQLGRGSTGLPSLAPVVERLLPSVVNISTTQTISRRPFEMPQFPEGSIFEQLLPEVMEGSRFPNRAQKNTSLGSGFIVSDDGYIVTNNHVISEAEEITVTLWDDTELKAKVVGRDHRTDLALLKVEAPYKLPAVEWGDASHARVGDWVILVGNPYGLGGSVTTGIVSARARDISRTRAGGVTEYVDDFIQTDASMNLGNSGGPMFKDGKVIGITTAILSPTGVNIGIGFAIPSSVARPVVEQLKQFGRTKRGWIGVNILRVSTDVAENIGLGTPRGALVGRVAAEGPAAKSGLKTWDVIVKFDGVSIPDPRKLTRLVGDTPVGKEVEAVVWRNQKEEAIKLTVGQLEEPDEFTSTLSYKLPKQQNIEALGLVVSTLTPEIRGQLDIKPEVEGVLILDVKPGSPAAFKRMRPDDVIVEVERVPTRTAEELSAALEKAVQEKKKSILVQYIRDDQPGFEALKLEAVVEAPPAPEVKKEEPAPAPAAIGVK